MATDMSTLLNETVHEQEERIDEDLPDDKSPINVNENGADVTTKEKKASATKVSIGVGEDAPLHYKVKPQTMSTTLGDDCNYTGDIYADKKHGTGTLSWADGRFYNGAFFADKRHGFGTFQVSGVSEFKGLYRNDERFGPGILIYKSTKSADVGLWAEEDLVRLLYPHPKLNLDLAITDKKPLDRSSFIIPSWFSTREILTTAVEFDAISRKKSSALFCKSVDDETSLFTRYLTEHSDRMDEALHERRAQIDAYLMSVNKNDAVEEKLFNDHIADILPPNETYEQRQLYYYTNKFWPLKQYAAFPVDEILSNARSSFPTVGPLESSSLALLDAAFNGETETLRELLMHQQVYADVSDSRGLCALHFATYNVHIDAVNLLLNYGANVNQLTDDGLTPLSIAFLLYYGNDPQETVNIALEHVDPVLMTSKSTSVADTKRSTSRDRLAPSREVASCTPRNIVSRTSAANDEKVGSTADSTRVSRLESLNPYGFELSDEMIERIQNEQFRKSVYILIKLLLRRGADPTLSDWPLPVLALAIRAGDKEMVELLLRKKAQVNCRLNAARHAHLTPLHVACGCMASTAIDIVKKLLAYGAQVNAESSPGGREYLSLADPLVVESKKLNEYIQRGRTPLHIACTRETKDALSLVRLLIDHHADVNAVCNGQTPLSLAIVTGNESLVDLLIEHAAIDPSTELGAGNGNALCTVLSTLHEPRWTYAKRLKLIERLIEKTPKVLYPIRFGIKNTLGSAVDYAYYSFFADARISQLPYHSLTPNERITLKQRKELLSHIATRFREEVSKYENFLRLPTPVIESTAQTPSTMMFLHRTVSRSRSLVTDRSGDLNSKVSTEFHYCATCGRSFGVRLVACKRCESVYFCSKTCKVTGWNSFHRLECQLKHSNSIADRPITTESTTSKGKLPALRPSTYQTDHTQMQSVDSRGTRIENFTALEGALFKEGALAVKPQPKPKDDTKRLPHLSVAKLLRQKRLKKWGNAFGNFPPTIPANAKDSSLSWNMMYNAPENYSYN